MNRRDSQQNTSRYSTRTKVRERATFSYEASSTDPDLKEQILKLRDMKDSPYWNRSLADITGMILLKYVPKEIQRCEKSEKGEE